jgi:hypothetical protein
MLMTLFNSRHRLLFFFDEPAQNFSFRRLTNGLYNYIFRFNDLCKGVVSGEPGQIQAAGRQVLLTSADLPLP